jgi:hypothetical protein
LRTIGRIETPFLIGRRTGTHFRHEALADHHHRCLRDLRGRLPCCRRAASGAGVRRGARPQGRGSDRRGRQGPDVQPTKGGWILSLVPGREGWFQISVKGREQEDLSRLTPPWHFVPNPREIEGWHFRNDRNTGPNDGSVNAPQERPVRPALHLLRRLHRPSFLASSAGKRAMGGLRLPEERRVP